MLYYHQGEMTIDIWGHLYHVGGAWALGPLVMRLHTLVIAEETIMMRCVIMKSSI